MNNLNILVATSGTKNPFIFQLIKFLQVQPNIRVAQHGLNWLNDRSFRFDVVLFQWPEVLLSWDPPTKENLKELNDTIAYWKQSGAKLVATIHNLLPHENNRYSLSNELYQLVYKNCDALVHMGESSKELFHETYPGLVKCREEIIPHGNYNFFKNDITRENARTKLNLPKDEFVLLVFGSLRTEEEIDLVIEASKYLKKISGKLLLVGRLPFRSKKQFKHYLVRSQVWTKKNIILNEGFISDENVQFYLNAADALFISRLKSLNSGNVALGYTFGKVVIGPDFGVIGEDLEKLGNPVFDVNQIEMTLKKAIEASQKLIETKQGEKNKDYSQHVMDWNRIADQYVKLFNDL